jgi:GAF domain-containing protein
MEAPGCHLLVLRDTSALARAEETKNRALVVAHRRLVEAESLRSAALVLTHSEPLNALLDRLLETMHAAIPYDCGRIFLLEAPGRLFPVRERSWTRRQGHSAEATAMLDVDVFPVLRQALSQPRGLVVADAGAAAENRNLPCEVARGSWLGVPIFAESETLGLLSLNHDRTDHFSESDLRLARELVIPVALAVSAARLRERAEICRAELERHLSNLPAA